VIDCEGAGGEILVTTLCYPIEAPKRAVKDLYKSRWHIDLDLRHLKTTLGMETLSCKAPEMAEKELWVNLLAYNLIRLLMAQSASLADTVPRSLSFKHTLQLWLAFYRQPQPGFAPEYIQELMQLIAQQLIA
jgi:hypothetical protein